MPYTDKTKQVEATRRSNQRRKARWLAAHPCVCGQPAVTLQRRDATKTPKVVWYLSEERIAAEVMTLCDTCKVGSRRKPAVARIRHKKTAAVTRTVKVKAAKKVSTPVHLVSLLDVERRNNRIAWREERRTRLGYGAHADVG